jgi:hypothetical protein
VKALVFAALTAVARPERSGVLKAAFRPNGA